VITPPGATGVGPVWVDEHGLDACAVAVQLAWSSAVDHCDVVAVWVPAPDGDVWVTRFPAGSKVWVVVFPSPSVAEVSSRVPPLVPPAVVSGV
jgi:hypothetical protein